MLHQNDIVLANRPPLLVGKYVGHNYTSMVWASYGNHWRSLRRIATVELLSSHRIHMLSPIRIDEVRSLLSRLFRSSIGNMGITVDIKSALFELAFNVMTRMISGKKYYGENLEEAKNFQEIAKGITETGKGANVVDFMPFMRLFGYGNVEKKLKEVYRNRDKLMQSAIEEWKKKKVESDADDFWDNNSGRRRKQSIIQVLLSLQESEPESYPDEIIKGLLAVLYQASTETTAITMEWAFSLLLPLGGLHGPRLSRSTRNHGVGERLYRMILRYGKCLKSLSLRDSRVGQRLKMISHSCLLTQGEGAVLEKPWPCAALFWH